MKGQSRGKRFSRQQDVTKIYSKTDLKAMNHHNNNGRIALVIIMIIFFREKFRRKREKNSSSSLELVLVLPLLK